MITRYIKIAIFVFLILLPSYSFAGVVFEDDFDSYTTNPCESAVWVQANSGCWLIDNTNSSTTPNSIKANINGTNNGIYKILATSTEEGEVKWSGYFTKLSNTSDYSLMSLVITDSNWPSGNSYNISIIKNNNKIYLATSTEESEIQDGEWVDIIIQWREIGGIIQLRYKTNTSYYSDWEDTTLTTVKSYSLYGSGSSQIKVNIDDFLIRDTLYSPDIIDGESTRILSISPANNEVIATTTVNGVEGATTTIAVEWYINNEDISFIQGLEIQIINLDQNKIYGTRLLSPYSIVNNIDPESGYGSYSYEIWLPYGGYKISADINTNYLGGLINNPFAEQGNGLVASQDESNPLHQYHIYTVGGNTLISGLQQNINNQLEGILGATSTGATIADCNVLVDFNAGECLAFMFIPSDEQVNSFFNVVSNNIFSKFPLGYVWSVVTIFSDETTEAIPIIQGTIQGTGVADGVSFSLPLEAGMFDWFYNATSSKYGNSTATFFETTYEYWKIFVYLMLAVYMLQRILGTGVIGILNNDAIQTKRDFKRFVGKL